MLGGIYIGLSGMSAYSRGLQTISNNVANLNTSGYKVTDVAFNDVFATGGGINGQLGGSFQKSGSGIRIGNPVIDFTQGDLRQTSNDLDLAIQGDGFLVLHHDDGTFFTRTGSFVLDDDGFLVEQDSKFRLTVVDAASSPVDVNLDDRRISAAAATTKVSFRGNLTSTNQAASFDVSNITVWDSGGTKHLWKANFSTTDGSTGFDEWAVTVTDEDGGTVGTGTVRFIGSIVDPSTETLTIAANPPGAEPLSVTFDFSASVTSNSSSNSLAVDTADGNGVGALSTVTVDDDGHIKLTYSNEKTDTLGAISIATFRDPQALERTGAGVYRNTGDEQPRILSSSKEGAGSLQSRHIEASNVDLSQEFGDLILIQRGFQACSQVLSVSNDMIQQLFGVRGQG